MGLAVPILHHSNCRLQLTSQARVPIGPRSRLCDQTTLFSRRRLLAITRAARCKERFAVDRQDPIDVDVQAPDVGLEINRERIWHFGWFRARRAWSEDVGFDENFSLRR